MPLAASHMKVAEYARTVWDITPPAGTVIADLMNPAWWVHVAEKLRPWDRIEVRAEDGTWYAELIVRNQTRLSAEVAVVFKVELGKPAMLAKPGDIYKVEFVPKHQWRVLRLADKAVMSKDHATRDAAERVMAGLYRPLAEPAAA